MASPPIKVVDSSSSYASYPSSHDGLRSAAVAKPPLKVSSGLRQRLFEFYSMVDPSKATPKIVDAIMEAYAGDWLTLDADLRDKYREQFSGLGSPPQLLEVEDNDSRVSAARSASSTSSSVGVFQEEPTCSTCGSHQFVFARKSTSPTRDAAPYQTKSSIKKQPSSQSDVHKSNRPVSFKEVPSKQPSVARPGSTSRYSTPMSAPDYHRSVTPINTAEYEKKMWRRASSGFEVEPPQREQHSEADSFTEREMAAQDLPSRETEQQSTGLSKREHDEEEAPVVASQQEEGPDGWFEPTMIGDSFYRSHHPKAVDEQPKGTLLPETVREDEEEGDFKKEHSKSRTPAGWQEQTSMVSPTTTALDSAGLQQQRLSYYQQRSLPQSMLVQPRPIVEEISTSSPNNLEETNTVEPIPDGPMSLRSSPPRRQPAFLDGSSPASGDSLVNTSGIRRRPAQLAAEKSILAGMILPSSSDEVKNHTILTRKVVS